MDRPLIAIVGSTGTGKSSLALRLAEACSGEIVNCDSVQLYRGFDIGSAKTPVEERRGIPHHLISILDAHEICSAGDFARMGRAAVAEITARDRVPLVTGGTGFYLRALLDGLPDLPSRHDRLRERLMLREQARAGALHRILSRLDPGAARRIHRNDAQKTLRALEIRILTKNRLPAPDPDAALAGYRVLLLGLDPDRAELAERLNHRAAEMFSSGLIEEVRSLLRGGATGSEKPFESLGYKQALEFVQGASTLEQAIARTQIETRQYAKRQRTWFRRDPRVRWVSGFGHALPVLEQCLKAAQIFLGNKSHF